MVTHEDGLISLPSHKAAFLASKAEGIKEGLRRAAEIMRGRKVLASDFYYELLLKEIGE